MSSDSSWSVHLGGKTYYFINIAWFAGTKRVERKTGCEAWPVAEQQFDLLKQLKTSPQAEGRVISQFWKPRYHLPVRLSTITTSISLTTWLVDCYRFPKIRVASTRVFSVWTTMALAYADGNAACLLVPVVIFPCKRLTSSREKATEHHQRENKKPKVFTDFHLFSEFLLPFPS